MDVFAEVKSRINVVDLITSTTGFKMGAHHLSECPFCNGHDCFSIEPTAGFKCWQCDKKGDAITFLELFHQVDTKTALEQAAKHAGVDLPKRSGKKTRTTPPSPAEQILLDTASYYHQNMLANGGQSYLMEDRGHALAVLKDMGIGWSDGGLTDFLRSKGYTDSDIETAGLARKRTIKGKDALTDFFGTGLVLFPHRSRGKVTHFTQKDPAKKAKFQWPNKYRSDRWIFYNQDAIDTYGEIILVEGENDLLSVMGGGAKNVIAMIGQISDEQIRALKNRMRGKTLLLWLDNDTTGTKYIRKICKALSGITVRIITYAGAEDPDEYLRQNVTDRKAAIRNLVEAAVPYISWEISQAALLPDLGAKLEYLREHEVFQAITGLAEIEQDIYLERLHHLGFSKKAIEEQLDHSQDLRRSIAVYMEGLTNKRDADPNLVASLIYDSYSRTGRFFRDPDDKVYLLHGDRIYDVNSNRPFNSLLKRTTNLLVTKEPGRSILESLACEGFNQGALINRATWIHTDRAKDAVFINLNNPGNMILRIDKTRVAEIPNGLNEEGIFLKSSRKILPFTYRPDVAIEDAMAGLREHVFNYLACPVEQRYFIMCWFISAFLLDFTPNQALLKFSGGTASGKTTAARLLSILCYGDEHLGDPSAAAAYSLAAQNPMLVIDNLESDDMGKSLSKFLLLSATRGSKEKRTSGTESDTTEEAPKSLVLITAIEPFVKSELINRTIDIEFSHAHQQDDFIEDETTRAITQQRDFILSGILRFIQAHILPNLARRRDYITILKKEYRGHSKDRLDAYIALLSLILEHLMPYIPRYKEDDFLYGVDSGESDIRRAWITYQDTKAKDTEISSNSILKLLEGMVREYLAAMKEVRPSPKAGYPEDVFCYTHPEYLIDVVKTSPTVEEDGDDRYTVATMEFVATSGEICAAFDRYCKNNGIRNPYSTASVFASRLRNDMRLLEKSGWKLDTKPGLEPYYRKMKGQRYWKFIKTIVR